jgi:2'-hydroxyisoflavone reductase
MYRRSFLTSTLGTVAAAALPLRVRAADSLSVLILGGTGFVGPHVVERLLARGHTVTLFNRGRTNPQLFPTVEKLRGDRKTDVGALEGRSFDAVIDTSAYIPADVTRVATLLAPRVKHYQIISSISAYANFSKPGMDESHPLATLKDPSVEEVTGETYGGLKVLCEQAAEAALPGRTLVIRPGLIVGPGDTTDRFTYWPVRVSRGGEVLAPNTPDDPIQFIDVRDLAAFMVQTLEQRTVGIFNADAREGSITTGSLLTTCRDVAKSDARFVWVPADFLAEQKVRPWADLPVWVPPTGDEAGIGHISTAKARKTGLTYRPVADTVADTLAFYRDWPADRRAKGLRAGLSAEREAEVLAAWKTHQSTSR